MSSTRIPISPPPFHPQVMSVPQAQSPFHAAPGTVILGTLTPSALKRRNAPKYQIYAGISPPEYHLELPYVVQPISFEGFPPLPIPQGLEQESHTPPLKPASFEPGLLSPQYGVENVALEMKLMKLPPSPKLHVSICLQLLLCSAR